MTFPTKTLQRLTSAAIVLLAGAASLKAQTVHWGNALLDSLVRSDGAEITTGDGFTFQLGVFESGFTPTAANPGSWLANWRPLDAAFFNDAANYFTSSFNIIQDGGNPLLGFSDSPEAHPGLRVQAGEQLWMLVYNNMNMDTTTELFLGGAGTWTLPTIASQQNTMPQNYRLSQGLNTPVFGGWNDNRGGGNYTALPTVFDLQTARFVPEPSSFALPLTVLLLSGLRRRRPQA